MDDDWLTVQGGFGGNVATAPIYRTGGGKFNDPLAVLTEAVGVAAFVFSSRTEGQVTIQFTDTATQMVIPLQRATPPPLDRQQRQTRVEQQCSTGVTCGGGRFPASPDSPSLGDSASLRCQESPGTARSTVTPLLPA